MTNPTQEQIAMARRIANTITGSTESEADEWAPHWFIARDSALAAIIETHRLDAELADGHGLEGSDEALTADCIATAIRAGKHYGKGEE